MKTKILFVLLVFVTGQAVLGQQTSQTGDLIQGGINDGNKLVDAYTEPLNKAVVYSLGEFNYTGFRHYGDKKFSIGFKTIFLVAPVSDRTYHINELNLQTLEAEDPHNDEAQTILGDSTSYVWIASKEKILGQPAFKFKSPTGSGYPGFPLPYIDFNYRNGNWNFGLGIIPLVPVPTTDLNIFMLRGSVERNLLSGEKDRKTEWTIKMGFGYFHGYSLLNVKPGKVVINGSYNSQQSGDYDNQKLLIDYASFSFASHYAYYLSKHWRVYGGAGLVLGGSSIRMVGTYPVYESDPMGIVSVVATDVEDPLNIQKPYVTVFGEAGLRADWNRWYLQFQTHLSFYMGGSLAFGYKF